MFIDIDFFKKVNDNFGQQVGDMALTHVAERLRDQLRSNDILARYGGEEFVALLPTASEKKGIEAAERMRKAVSEAILEIPGHPALELTVSIGFSTLVVDQPGVSESIDKSILIEVADKAVYLAKNAGRNVVISGGEVMAGSTVKKQSA